MISYTDYTDHQIRYLAEQIKLKHPDDSTEGLTSAMSDAKVDVNPHQVAAALFALHSPLSNGVILADEVGLGKTIEACLVLAEYWSEYKRKILLVVPAALRTQWRTELMEKFFIDSVILETPVLKKLPKSKIADAFTPSDKVVICSYDFAAKHEAEVKSVRWNLVIMDEAHRLRNVYKSDRKTAGKLKQALKDRKKLLLTATPLQNDLMELYGLTSIIDDKIFGDHKTFKDMYMSRNNSELRNVELKKRLKNFCKRTLRRQVKEYINYPKRTSIVEQYEPSEEEERLYRAISEYLQTQHLYALPDGQRTLIIMVMRKLLASSSFAINATLQKLIERLETMLENETKEIDLAEDFDTIPQYLDSFPEDVADNRLANDIIDVEGITEELELLKSFSNLASSITNNAKGDKLCIALEKGFQKIEELGGQKKAVIFTESRRTQKYVWDILEKNGYEGQIVLLDGNNNDDVSKAVYKDWKKRHKDDGTISGSKAVDMKAAIVEKFQNDATILIGTEAASEGINLQFCSIVVNFDLPWNPQRVEQRIGRCHRYGQKNDVVVINFLNGKNAADKRVYELLEKKFKLFDGVFGASDEILGAIENGTDFEKRIAEIYQKCRTPEEINSGFDKLQSENFEQINNQMLKTRQSVFEEFDDDVISRLKFHDENTRHCLNTFHRKLYDFLIMCGATSVSANEEEFRFKIPENDKQIYNLDWKDAELKKEIFFRKDNSSFLNVRLNTATEKILPKVNIQFSYTNSRQNIKFFSDKIGLKGLLSVEKMKHSNDDTVFGEYLILTTTNNFNVDIPDDMVDRMFTLPGKISGTFAGETAEFEELKEKLKEAQKKEINAANRKFWLEECDKLDAYANDLKIGLERKIEKIDKKIDEQKKFFRDNKDVLTMEKLLPIRNKITTLESKRTAMRNDLNLQRDEIDRQNEQMQENMRKKLAGKIEIEEIMTFSFEIVE